MGKNNDKKTVLVIVESPGKIQKIQNYLNELSSSNGLNTEFIVKASFGHCRDLHPKELSIDIENNFKPTYHINSGRYRTIVNDLKGLAKDCSDVILAADEDREGEMIAYSLKELLKLNNPKRIVFHEITKSALERAINNPGQINVNMVEAQQARRLLDRIIGWKLSPILWKALKGKVSAGRVQSAGLKIIKEKETEISNSISSPFYKIVAVFFTNTKPKKEFRSNYFNKNKVKNLNSLDECKEFLNLFLIKKSENIIFIITDKISKESTRNPSPPFTTSTLQQDASSKYHFSVKRTMDVAQKLYEAGHITYMRTDSVNLSNDIKKDIKKYVIDNYGDKYYKDRNYSNKSKGAQEAHEAIRPTKISNKTIQLNSDCEKLYQLIWKRTVASLMATAIFDNLTFIIDVQLDNKSILPKNENFQSTSQTVKFDGYMVVYSNVPNDDDTSPSNEVNFDLPLKTILGMREIKTNQEYTKPPVRYNEASFIKYLEKVGIGRPSTYASIVTLLVDRQYVICKDIDGIQKDSTTLTIDTKSLTDPKDSDLRHKIKEKSNKIVIGKENKKFTITPLGNQIINYLDNNFSDIVDTKFTAKIETNLDKIADGNIKWVKVLSEFYGGFNEQLSKCSDSTDSNTNGITGDILDELVGEYENSEDDTPISIYKGSSKYGPYIKIKQTESKWRFCSITDEEFENMDLKTAIKILKYPKKLVKYKNKPIIVNRSKNGYYLSWGDLKKNIDDRKISKEDAIKTIEEIESKFDNKDNNDKPFIINKKQVFIKDGPYGKYLQVKPTIKSKAINISVPEDFSIDTYTIDDVTEIIQRRIKTF